MGNAGSGNNAAKRPISVLVLIHTPNLHVLLLERASHPGFWQSITGSQEGGETLTGTAIREVNEETGLDASRYALTAWNVSNRFEIFHEWRERYAPGVTHNIEHVFTLEIPAPQPVNVAPDEHLAYCWLPWHEAADRVFSWTNRDAILSLALSRRKF